MIDESQLLEPSWLSPPGDTIADLLEEQGWTQAEFATRTGYTKKHINLLIKGAASITESTALILEKVLGSSARFWLTREAQYCEARASKDEIARLKAEVGWLKELPIRELVRLRWISKMHTRAEQVLACLKFFGVASVTAWRERYEKPLAAFRASSKYEKKLGSIAAWLCEGERRASRIPCLPFNKDSFQSELANLRSLSLESDPRVFCPRLIDTCAKHGIAVVFLPAPEGCPASGATRWISPEKAMLLLSLRHKSNDVLWFTFFHEVGHLLLHGKKLLFLEGTDGIKQEHEDEADRFASDILIQPTEACRLPDLGYQKDVVIAFAKHIGVAPGIVVGRMQKEQLLPWSHLNDLKVRYLWSDYPKT
jgi:HTH-type transcriptional regulator / antitoxin HigA